ncbi:hypothetical protein MBLNU457_g0263t1 [Dothideomycetes sp. NU457]
MSTQVIPPGGLVLHNVPTKTIRDGNQSASAQAVAVCKLNNEVVKELQQLARNSKGFTLLTGKTLKLKYGTKTVQLAVSPETFQHEIYQSSGSSSDLTFKGAVTQIATLKASEPSSDDAAGTDAALANLKQSLASFAQEKEAKKATISTGIVNTKNKSVQPPRRNDLNSSLRAQSSNSSLYPGQSLSSSDPQHLAREKAMDRVILHFLAAKPSTEQQISAHTHIPLGKCRERLAKVADEDATTHEWTLRHKSFRELDLYGFKYRLESDREAAKENAIRAYDRLRLPKEDKLWDLLLPPQDRGKGIVVSKLQKALAATQASKEREKASTSQTSRSPMPHSDGQNDLKLSESKGTPKLGASSTPRSAGLSIEKRMKEARKAKVAEEAKKKRQEKEAAASDRESKPRPRPAQQAKKPLPSKIKSAEVVHESDDDEPRSHHKDSVVSTNGAKTKPSLEPRVPVQKAASRSPLPGTSQGNRTDSKTVTAAKSAVDKRDGKLGPDRKDARLTPRPESGLSSVPKKVTPNTTPSGRTEKHQSATTSTSRNATQLSPLRSNKPKVPSPLGPTRPRNTSTLSSAGDAPDRKDTRIGAQSSKVNGVSGPNKEEPRPAASTASAKKRPHTESSDDSDRPLKAARTDRPNGTAQPAARPTQRVVTGSQSSKDDDNNLKRKANDISSGVHDHNLGPEPKHRRTESSSTHSAKYSSNSSSSGSVTNTNGTSVSSPGWQRSPSNLSSSSEAARLSWEKAICLAEKFRSHYYPKYNKLYDELSSMPPEQVKEEDRKKLWDMHRRLEQMKREIRVASG